MQPRSGRFNSRQFQSRDSMGWKGKVVGKLGNLLSESLEVPLKQLYGLAAAKGDIQDQNQGLRDQNHANATRAAEAKDEFGPDTSSLTAFLLSLLSSSETSHRRPVDGSNPEASEETVGENVIGSTSGTWNTHIQKEQAGDVLCEEISMESLEQMRHRWKDEDVSLVASRHGQTEIQSSVTQLQGTPTKTIKLPPLSEDSLLLSESFRAFIYSSLPTLVKDRHWMLLYSTARHGISLHTLYRRSCALPGPLLLVAGDFQGVVFGGLVTAPLKPTTKRKYQGTNEMFVFTNVHGKPQVFKATGANRYYFLCMNDSIAFGGGGHFALHLDEDLLTGSSGACDTFGNHCLASSGDFSVANVELWGFAHTSRYSSYQAFREPQNVFGSEGL